VSQARPPLNQPKAPLLTSCCEEVAPLSQRGFFLVRADGRPLGVELGQVTQLFGLLSHLVLVSGQETRDLSNGHPAVERRPKKQQVRLQARSTSLSIRRNRKS
jgi:hypothetical protein